MSLKALALSGAKWGAAASIANSGLQLVQLTILARFLSPDDFGLMGMLTVVIGLAQAYGDMGVSNAIICKPNVTGDQLSSLYWLNILAGFLVFVGLYFATPWIAEFYREPRLNVLLRWSICSFLIMPLGQQFQALLQREMRFRELALCEVVARVAGCFVAIASAWRGAGVYSLIWGTLTNAAVLSCLLLATGASVHLPSFHFSPGEIRSFVKFGAFQMGERSLNYFNSNIDKLLIGRLLGSEALGYYSLAWNLVVQPVARVNPILTRVAFPVFSRLQDQPEALRKCFLKMLRVIATTNSVALFGIAAVAPVLVPVVFGLDWQPAAVPVQILALVSLLRAVISPIGSLLLAKGRADLGFTWNLALVSSQAIGIAFGAYWGEVNGVAAALFVLHAGYVLLAYRYLVLPLIGPCAREYASSALSAFWISSSMALGVGFLLVVLRPFAIDQRVLLAVAISVGAIYCGVLVLLTQRKLVRELIHWSGFAD